MSSNRTSQLQKSKSNCAEKSARRSRSTCCAVKTSAGSPNLPDCILNCTNNKKYHVTDFQCKSRCTLTSNCTSSSCEEKNSKCCYCCCCQDGGRCLEDGSACALADTLQKKSRSNFVKAFKNKLLSITKSEKFRSKTNLYDLETTNSHNNNVESTVRSEKFHKSLPKSWKMDRGNNSNNISTSKRNKACCKQKNDILNDSFEKGEELIKDGSVLCADECTTSSNSRGSNSNVLLLETSHQAGRINTTPCPFKTPYPFKKNYRMKTGKDCELLSFSTRDIDLTISFRTHNLADTSRQDQHSHYKPTKSSHSGYEPSSGYGHVSPPEFDQNFDNLSLDSLELGADFRTFNRKKTAKSSKLNKNPPQNSRTQKNDVVSPAKNTATTNRSSSSNDIILPYYDQVKQLTTPGWNLTNELMKLSSYGWYWGPLSKKAAEAKLSKLPDGFFLVRDSSDDRHLLSLSFRSFGQTLHTRIEHYNGMFSFYAKVLPGAVGLDADELHDDQNVGEGDVNVSEVGFKSVVELIENSMSDSRQNGVFCYSRVRSNANSRTFPVCLMRPVSRFSQISTLQHMCRFVLRQKVRLDHIDLLPLPHSIRSWLLETPY